MKHANNFLMPPWVCKLFIIIMMNPLFMRAAIAADNDLYNSVSLTQLITNLATQLPQVWLLITAICYVIGFFFVIEGVMKMKKYAEQRSMMSSEASMRGPLLYIFVGAAMIYLPSTLNAGLTTFWLNPSPYGYEEQINDKWRDLYNACIIVVQLVGLIAFIRGLVILTHLGQQGGGQHGQFGRAMAHIIGGIFLIDLFDTLQMIYDTFGLGSAFAPSPPQ